MKTKHGLVGLALLGVSLLIVVRLTIAQPGPPLPPGWEDYFSQGGSFTSSSSPPSPGEGGGEGDPPPPSQPYDFEGMGITIPEFATNSQLHLTLFEKGTNATYAFTNFNYDIYGRRKFNYHYRWHELSVGSVG